jgi:paraquat-inducible protein B
MRNMAKKTEMSSSSLWVVAIVLLALTAWMYFKR